MPMDLISQIIDKALNNEKEFKVPGDKNTFIFKKV